MTMLLFYAFRVTAIFTVVLACAVSVKQWAVLTRHSPVYLLCFVSLDCNSPIVLDLILYWSSGLPNPLLISSARNPGGGGGMIDSGTELKAERDYEGEKSAMVTEWPSVMPPQSKLPSWTKLRAMEGGSSTICFTEGNETIKIPTRTSTTCGKTSSDLDQSPGPEA